MAVTQQDIIDVIPRYISTRKVDVFQALVSLTNLGWGQKSKLYKMLDELLSLSIDAGTNTYSFDNKTFTYKLVSCKECLDSGMAYSLVGKEWKHIPCDKCTVYMDTKGA